MMFRGLLVATLFVAALSSSSPAGQAEGKMPITTSSAEALEEYNSGTAYLDHMQRENARPHFERAVELDPDFIMAWIGLAGSQARMKDTGEIMDRVYGMAEAASVSEGERLVLESMLAGRSGDRETPEKNTRKLAEMYPHDERRQMALGGLHSRKGEYELAVEAFEAALAANPGFTPVYNSLGYTYVTLGNLDKAEGIFRRAIELDPKNPNAHDSYAELLLKMGRHGESIASYENAMSADPLFPSAVMGIASNLIHLDRHEEARDRLHTAMDLAPHDGIRSGVCWATSVVYLDQGDIAGAIEQLQANFELSEKVDDLGAMALDLSNIAKLQMELGRSEEARDNYARALELRLRGDRPENIKTMMRVGALYNDARVLVSEGRLDAAQKLSVQFSQRVEEINGSPGMVRRAHELVGIVALAQGRYRTAIEELNQSRATTAANMYRLARAYEGSGNEARAREMYGYVVEYRGGLNVDYSLVRHRAAQKLAAL